MRGYDLSWLLCNRCFETVCPSETEFKFYLTNCEHKYCRKCINALLGQAGSVTGSNKSNQASTSGRVTIECCVCKTSCQIIQVTQHNFKASAIAPLCETLDLVREEMFEEMRTLYLDTLKSVDSQLFHYRLKVETLAKLLDQERNKSQAFQTKVEQAMKMYKQKLTSSEKEAQEWQKKYRIAVTSNENEIQEYQKKYRIAVTELCKIKRSLQSASQNSGSQRDVRQSREKPAAVTAPVNTPYAHDTSTFVPSRKNEYVSASFLSEARPDAYGRTQLNETRASLLSNSNFSNGGGSSTKLPKNIDYKKRLEQFFSGER